MATVLDIIDGNSGTLGFNGWEFTRIAIVNELVQPGWAMIVEATLDPGVPKMNESHPTIPDAYVVEVQPESMVFSGNTVRLVITYRQFTENYQVNLIGRKVIENRAWYVKNQTGIDPPGNPPGHKAKKESGITEAMTLSYTYPEDHPVEGLRGVTDTQGVNLDVSVTVPDIVIQRTEWLTNLSDTLSGYPIGVQLTGNILLDRSVIYSDSLNAAGWNIRPFDKQGIWQCSITSQSVGNGFDWRVTYRFRFDKNSWEYNAVFEDESKGQPVPDPTYGAPVQSEDDFAQYYLRDFSLLELR